MAVLLKSVVGIPAPEFPIPQGVVLSDQARIARGRFYPVTFLFTAYAASVVGPALVFHPLHALIFFPLGVACWTLLEYLVHRHVLHGRFADGPGFLKHRMHTFFDTMHADHHRRPWDGMYINGYLDAIPFAVLFAAMSFVFSPYYRAPVFVAALLQCYVVEEWVHYSVHFHTFKSRYFRYIRRHHWYHHSRGEVGEAFGLTNGIWDRVLGTRIPPRPWPRAPRRLPAGALARSRAPHRPPDPSGAMGPDVDQPRPIGEVAAEPAPSAPSGPSART